MAVYVDDMQMSAEVPNGRRTVRGSWSHLTADTDQELHSAAEKIGLKRAYHQPSPPASRSHYDVVESKRLLAIKHGAIPVPYWCEPWRAEVQNRTWVLLDCNYLCWKAFYSTGGLTHEGDPTGVIYGFLRDVANLRERFDALRTMVFCWDHGKGIREQRYPFYKETRRNRKVDDVEQAALEGLHSQIAKLKHTIVPDLGYSNNFYHEGYEADDIIGSIVRRNPTRQCVIVSGDQDYYQLLSENCSIYQQQKDLLYTDRLFKNEWKIKPMDWVAVKAVAGCSSDDVPGVEGVGNKTAAKYIRGELMPGKKKDAIEAFKKSKMYIRNLVLVRLPLGGVKQFNSYLSRPDPKEWDKLMRELGINTLPTSNPTGKVRFKERMEGRDRAEKRG